MALGATELSLSWSLGSLGMPIEIDTLTLSNLARCDRALIVLVRWL